MIEPEMISVIILNWNGAQFLPRCLQSLREQTLRNIKIVLADNGSADDSISLTRRDFPEVEVLEFGANLGYAAGNNRAAIRSRAKYLFFLNNDTYLHPEALAEIVSVAESLPSAAIIAPQQRTYDGVQILHVGVGVDVLGYPCQGKTFYCDGAAMFIRRDVFVALGGFDPWYFMFFEDIDLCWRARLWGYRVARAPRAVVYHMSGGTAGSALVEGNKYATTMQRRRLGHRNQLATLLKNYSAWALLVFFPLFALLTAAEVFLLIVTRQRAAVREAYVPAWRDLLASRSHICAMRRRAQGSRTVSDRSILRRMEWKLAAAALFFRVGVPTVK